MHLDVHSFYFSVQDWFVEFQAERERLQSERQAERERLQSERERQIYGCNAILWDVKIQILHTLFGSGIRQFISQKANEIGITGNIRRTSHSYVSLRYEGNQAQMALFESFLGQNNSRLYEVEMKSSTSIYSRSIGFTTLTNTHIRCDRNEDSNGHEWEKKSSSVGSDTEVSRF